MLFPVVGSYGREERSISGGQHEVFVTFTAHDGECVSELELKNKWFRILFLGKRNILDSKCNLYRVIKIPSFFYPENE